MELGFGTAAVAFQTGDEKLAGVEAGLAGIETGLAGIETGLAGETGKLVEGWQAGLVGNWKTGWRLESRTEVGWEAD